MTLKGNETVPRVTVLMSVYNGEAYLRQAIDSILNQTYQDFEFLIVNDGSTDSSRDIILSYKDPRIRMIDNQHNMGLTKSLNRGLEKAKGKFIARMDADDISLPDRFSKQISFLEQHPEVGVLGTWLESIDINGETASIWKMPVSHSLIVWTLQFNNYLMHPTVMMRRDLVKRAGGYNLIGPSQDYDLWCRLAKQTRMANLPEPLVRHRLHESSIGSVFSQKQRDNSLKNSQRFVSQMLGERIQLEVFDSLRQVGDGLTLDTRQKVDDVANLIVKLYRAYIRQRSIAPNESQQVCSDATERLMRLAKRHVDLFPFLALLIQWKAILLQPRMALSRSNLGFIKRELIALIQKYIIHTKYF